MILLKA